MNDVLLRIAERPIARRILEGSGLPIPMPEPLVRVKGPYAERPLEGKRVALGKSAGSGEGALDAVVHRTLDGAGATPVTEGALAGDERVHALVFDATGIDSPAALRGLYDFFHAAIGRLARSGRVVVLGRPANEARSGSEAAARAALEGFTRSLGKEIGRKGATANVVFVRAGAADRAEGVLRFLLSPASAFVTAQPFVVSTEVASGSTRGWAQSLAGKVALVTGAARGIGAATAERLALEGAHVVCLDRPADEEPLAAVVRSTGGSALLADVTAADAPKLISEHLLRAHGGVDVVVHNAGVTRDKTLARMPEALWDQAIDINLGAVDRITAALRPSALRDGGRVVCLSSVAGIAGNVGQTNYAASKAGIIGIVRHWAKELAPRGVAVNAVAPGFIETRLTSAIPLMIREAGRRLAALGQGGLPEDVANAITFLGSPGASGLSGSIVRVCGGALIGA